MSRIAVANLREWLNSHDREMRENNMPLGAWDSMKAGVICSETSYVKEDQNVGVDGRLKVRILQIISSKSEGYAKVGIVGFELELHLGFWNFFSDLPRGETRDSILDKLVSLGFYECFQRLQVLEGAARLDSLGIQN